MPQVFQFTPSQVQNFQFQPVLDGNLYTATVYWLTYGQRYYIRLVDSNGNLIFNLPVIGSPDQIQISALLWDFAAQKVRVALPLSLLPNFSWTNFFNAQTGQTLNLVVQGCSPSTYNGTFPTLLEDFASLGVAYSASYAMASDPGAASVFGTMGFEVNLAQGYFTTSRMVFRTSTQQFIVSP